MNWTTYTNEHGMPDVTGSDGGVIVADEEHGLGARITLERLGEIEPFCITCGIYDWMMHTRYVATGNQAQQDYAAMKVELDKIIEMIPLRSDPELDQKIDRATQAMAAFVDKFP